MTARFVRLAVLMFGIVATVFVTAPTASAADPADGWVRLAHLSPDTPNVDVRLTAVNDGAVVLELQSVAYGDISDYQRVPAGTYIASMLPPGAQTGAAPVVTQAVTVSTGNAYTVAAVGLNANLTGQVFADDLTPPTPGYARVRLLQGSSAAPLVTVAAVNGPTIASNAVFGTATEYAEVPAGSWPLQVTPETGSTPASTASVVLDPGSVDTVVVLDGGTGVTVMTALDAAGVAAMPTGGVQTGGGGTAPGIPAQPLAPVALAAAVVFGGLWSLRAGARRA